MNIRKNIFLALTSGFLLGMPWAVSSLFFVIFFAWVPLLIIEEKTRHHPLSSDTPPGSQDIPQQKTGKSTVEYDVGVWVVPGLFFYDQKGHPGKKNHKE